MYHYCVILLEKVNPEPKKEKDTKPQTKSQSKASTKKTSNRRSPLKKEKNGVSAPDTCPPEPVESQVVAPCSEDNDEPQPGNGCSPAHKLFQRTLSPADVLHVHSYAKGDYGEGDALLKEEKKSEGSDSEMERDNRHVGKAVSGHRCYTQLMLYFTCLGLLPVSCVYASCKLWKSCFFFFFLPCCKTLHKHHLKTKYRC